MRRFLAGVIIGTFIGTVAGIIIGPMTMKGNTNRLLSSSANRMARGRGNKRCVRKIG